jgi:hypothetical protein
MNRFVRPDSTILTLENGDTIIVKVRLNTGETREMRGAILNPDEQSHADRTAYAVVVAYLLDWTLTDSGRPVVIRDQPVSVVRAALNALDYDSFIEIANAIGDHVHRQNALRDEEKKSLNTAPSSSETLPSPFAAAGVTNG